MRYLIVAAALLLAFPAFAEDAPRKIDFTAALSDDGVPFVDDGQCPVNRDTFKRPCETQLTLGRAAYYALRIGEPNTSWDESSHRDELAKSIRDAKDWPLLAADRETIKKAMAKMYTPPLIGAAGKLLEPAK